MKVKGKTLVLGTFFTSLALIFGYLCYLIPLSLFARNINTFEKEVGEIQAMLMENRLAMVEFAKLNVDDKDFGEKRINLISKLAKTQEELTNKLNSSKKIEISLKAVKKDQVTFINQEAKNLLNESKDVIENQKKNLDRLYTLEENFFNIFYYDPELDFIDPINSENLGENEERISLAIEGFKKIQTNLSTLNIDGNLTSQVDSTIYNFEQALTNINNNNLTQSNYYIEEIKEEYSNLKNRAFQEELNIISSEENIKNLTKQTNLLIRVNYLMKETDKLKLEILRKTYFKPELINN